MSLVVGAQAITACSGSYGLLCHVALGLFYGFTYITRFFGDLCFLV